MAHGIIKLEENMVLINVIKFDKILIKTIRLREWTLIQTVNIHKQRAITPESMMRYQPLSKLKNNVTKLHKILIITIQLRELTSFLTVNLHKQRAITPEIMV